MQLQNIKFIKQEIDCCCPASIEIVLRYYGYQGEYNQIHFLNLLNHYSISNKLSFFQTVNAIYPAYYNNYSFKELNFISYQEWQNNLISYLNCNIPVIISSNNKNGGYHISVIYGYTIKNDSFVFYEVCPELGFKVNDFNDKKDDFGNNGTDLLIITKI